MKIKKLVGKNLYLGPVSRKHIPRIAKWMNDIEVLKYLAQFPKKHTEETAKAFLEKSIKDLNSHYYGIYLNNGKLIGSTDLTEVDGVHRTASLGIVIGEKEYWGKGYGTEAITLLVDYGFNVLNLNNIFLSLYDFNKRAYKCYEKVGFKIIGKRRKSRFLAGKYYNEIYMDILAKDFKKSKLKELLK